MEYHAFEIIVPLSSDASIDFMMLFLAVSLIFSLMKLQTCQSARLKQLDSME